MLGNLRALIGDLTQRPLTANDRVYLEDDGMAAQILSGGAPELDERQSIAQAAGQPRPRGALRPEDRELADEHALFKFAIRHGSRLKIVRERAAPEFEYICGSAFFFFVCFLCFPLVIDPNHDYASGVVDPGF
jgi:hypothetical protein